MRVLASNTLARLSLVRSVSYSASLFVAGNYNLITYFKISPSGDMRTILAPPAFLVTDPFVRTVHVVFGGSSSS